MAARLGRGSVLCAMTKLKPGTTRLRPDRDSSPSLFPSNVVELDPKDKLATTSAARKNVIVESTLPRSQLRLACTAEADTSE